MRNILIKKYYYFLYYFYLLSCVSTPPSTSRSIYLSDTYYPNRNCFETICIDRGIANLSSATDARFKRVNGVTDIFLQLVTKYDKVHLIFTDEKGITKLFFKRG